MPLKFLKRHRFSLSLFFSFLELKENKKNLEKKKKTKVASYSQRSLKADSPKISARSIFSSSSPPSDFAIRAASSTAILSWRISSSTRVAIWKSPISNSHRQGADPTRRALAHPVQHACLRGSGDFDKERLQWRDGRRLVMRRRFVRSERGLFAV